MFGGVYGHIGLKALGRRHFHLYHDEGIERVRLFASPSKLRCRGTFGIGAFPILTTGSCRCGKFLFFSFNGHFFSGHKYRALATNDTLFSFKELVVWENGEKNDPHSRCGTIFFCVTNGKRDL